MRLFMRAKAIGLVSAARLRSARAVRRRLVAISAVVGSLLAVVGAAPAARADTSGYHIWRNGNSGRCLGVSGGIMTNGRPIIQWDCGDPVNHPDQYWTAVDLSQPGVRYQFRNMADPSKCLGVPAGSTKEGVQLVIWECLDMANHPDQWWTTWPANQISTYNGYLLYQNHLTSSPGTTVIAVAASATNNGAAIVQWGWTSTPDQYWYPS
jgi:hypothetical protein